MDASNENEHLSQNIGEQTDEGNEVCTNTAFFNIRPPHSPRLRTHYESALTHASLVYGVPRNERSRVLGVRVRGGGEPASRRDCFKGKVTLIM